MNQISLTAVPNLPLINEGDDFAQILIEACGNAQISIEENDVIVIAHKVISKAEGAQINQADVTPSEIAKDLSEKTGRDAKLCQVIIDESAEILGTNGRMIITKHRLGFICTNAAVDHSNAGSEGERFVTLPKDPDASARLIREKVKNHLGVNIAVIINDSFGKADRKGSIGVAIGIAGIAAVEELIQQDLYGRESSPSIARIDELSAAASMLQGQANEGLPVVVIRGAQYTRSETDGIAAILTS